MYKLGLTDHTSHFYFFEILFSVLSCNFDNGMCGFAQSNNDKFDWTRKSGGTSSLNTGPSADDQNGKMINLYVVKHDTKIVKGISVRKIRETEREPFIQFCSILYPKLLLLREQFSMMSVKIPSARLFQVSYHFPVLPVLS